MASKQHDFKPGDVFFLAKGRVVAQKACVRGEPPADTAKWCVVGEPGRGWMGIETFAQPPTESR
jgi:hypothetical protein